MKHTSRLDRPSYGVRALGVRQISGRRGRISPSSGGSISCSTEPTTIPSAINVPLARAVPRRSIEELRLELEPLPSTMKAAALNKWYPSAKTFVRTPLRTPMVRAAGRPVGVPGVGSRIPSPPAAHLRRVPVAEQLANGVPPPTRWTLQPRCARALQASPPPPAAGAHCSAHASISGRRFSRRSERA